MCTNGRSQSTHAGWRQQRAMQENFLPLKSKSASDRKNTGRGTDSRSYMAMWNKTAVHSARRGIRVPGSAGETTHALEQPHGIRSLIMADGPAGTGCISRMR